MAYHGVLIPAAIAATNIDSLNRPAIQSASPIDNGNVFQLATKSASVPGGYSEVWVATLPATGSLSSLWMAYSGDEIVTVDSRYKGIDPDVRNFFTAAGKVFSAYKPQLGDIIVLNAEALSGAIGGNTYVVAANGSFKLTPAAAAGAGLSYKLLKTTYISLATGAIDSQRVTAYEFECVQL